MKAVGDLSLTRIGSFQAGDIGRSHILLAFNSWCPKVGAPRVGAPPNEGLPRLRGGEGRFMCCGLHSRTATTGLVNLDEGGSFRC